ncbi:cysteine-rich receptor-like protein kinase 2 [Cryptomeria japonica]|uniref:cysteine-rich receptor-like protein kinase 2 n=1 Tax=Cryptomeria japonica TaxID=3369 RepID=UPI0027DA0411|nr:cysteine-rich receptor-like protein kinase 2 [Cryptomeria japonica]XP_059065142.1 cysteine-rich receptor-like protein kinase 2 [Cryptomeria japonica]
MLIVAVYVGYFLVFTDKSAADQNTSNALHGCTSYNPLNASVYKANLDPVLNSLAKDISTSRFGNKSQGTGGDEVYGLAQCRADFPLSHCVQCFQEARDQLALFCPTQNGGRVYVDGCFLRYANATFFAQPYDTGSSNCSSSSNSSAEKFSEKTLKLITDTVGRAPANNSFAIAWTDDSTSSTNIYALAECWESLASDGCQTCLEQAQNQIGNCLPSTQGQVLEAGCYLRYDTNSFFSLNGLAATNTDQGGGSKSKTVGISVGITGGAVLVIVAAFFAYFKFRQPTFGSERLDIYQPGDFRCQFAGEESNFGEKAVRFDYEQLREATDSFDDKNKIGEGGFGQVYKGTLQSGRQIAVKRLLASESERVTNEFWTEIEVISSVSHRNLVTLLGCCTLQDQRFLVLEYMANRSLDKHLFGKRKTSLSWEARFDIILGTARGLAYIHELHEHSHVRIVHRDIKAANILLDDKFQPKIADFGLARLFPHDRTHLTTRVGGTLGYTAPEYAVHGQLTEKADVYSYGVVVLEIISGRKSIQTGLPCDTQHLLPWTWRLYQRNEGLSIVDPRLEGKFGAEQVLKVMNIALACTHDSPSKRPSMSNVVSMLAPVSVEARPVKPTFMEIDSDAQHMLSGSTSQLGSSSAAGPSNSSASITHSLQAR